MAGDGGSQAPMAYNPGWQQGADQTFQNLTSNAAGYAGALPGQVLPQLQQAVGGVVNNPYAAGAQDNANRVAQIGTGQVAPSQFAGSQALSNLAGFATPLAQSIIQTGFDPQSALYSRSWQQNIDQTNAINAMNGVSGTPYGAGLMTQANQNFNIDWQNQQLGRQLSALGGYGSALGAATQGYDAASNLGNTGLATMAQAGSQPYNTSIGQSQNSMSALERLISGTSGALAPSLGLNSSLATYLGLGQSATSINDSATAQNNAQQQNFWSGMASLFGGQNLGQMFSQGANVAGSWITNLGQGAAPAGGMAGASDLMSGLPGMMMFA